MTALALPAPSLAKDPLLSGYGGPGGGEQVLLGSRLTGGSGGSGASTATAAPGSLRVPSAASGTAPSSAGSASTPTAPASPATGHAKGAAKAGQHRGAGSTKAKSTTPSAAAPRQVSYPTRADDAGGFPFSAGELAVGALALVGVAGLAVWLRRTAAHSGGPGAQASA